MARMDTPTPLADTILDAATQILVNDSVSALTYGSIAESTGLTRDDVATTFPMFESILTALIRREAGSMIRVIADNVDRDPRGGLPSRIYGYSLSAVYEYPLARALYLGDPEGLNRIMRAINDLTALPDLSLHPELIGALQDVGMARRDVAPDHVTAVISTLGSGISLAAASQRLDDVHDGLMFMLEHAVDADVADTTPGKLVFQQYIATLSGGTVLP